MATSRAPSRAAVAARTQILGDLKDDHKRVKKAYREFQKLDIEQDPQACEAIVKQVLQELTVHATLEEELLYPAAHGAIAEEDLVDEAEVEHETVHMLIEQLRGMGPEDEKYAARFTVLCEYVAHHVKEEEGEMFPQLEQIRLDWESVAEEMNARRAELTAAAGDESDEDGEDADSETAVESGQEEMAETAEPATSAATPPASTRTTGAKTAKTAKAAKVAKSKSGG